MPLNQTKLYIKWLIFSCDLQSLYPAVRFLSKWLSGIMEIMNSKGDSAPPWNIPLRIFASDQLLPPVVNSTLQVSMVFSITFMNLYFVHFVAVYFPTLQNHIICLFVINAGHR